MKKIHVIVGSAVVLLIGLIVATVAFASSASEVLAPGEPGISSGATVQRDTLSANAQELININSVKGTITKFGEIRGTSFYGGMSEKGESCFVIASNTIGGSSAYCRLPGSTSKLEQLLPAIVTSVRGSRSLSELQITAVSGIANDEVKAVGLIDESGVLHSTEVVGNVFNMPAQDIPIGRPNALVVLGENGSVLLNLPMK